jgi:hypothetical protein
MKTNSARHGSTFVKIQRDGTSIPRTLGIREALPTGD